MSVFLTVVLCCLDSTKPRNVTLPGWHNILVPGRNITSTDRGHSIIDNVLVDCPDGVISTSITLRTRNHCFKYVVLILPVSVIGKFSVGIPNPFRMYCNSIPSPTWNFNRFRYDTGNVIVITLRNK